MAGMTAYLRIGELLVSEGLLTEDQLREALAWKAKTKRRFGEVLTELGFVLEDQVIAALAKQFDHPVADLTALTPEKEAIGLVTQAFAIQHLCLPISVTHSTLTVAIPDPLDIATIDMLSTSLKRRIEISLAPPSALKRAINRAYSQAPGQIRKRTVRPQADRAQLLSLLENSGWNESAPKKTLKEAS